MRFLAIALLAASAFADVTPISLYTKAADRVPDEYMVQFHKGARADFEEFKSKRFSMNAPVTVHEFSDYMGFWVKVSDEKLLSDIQQLPGVSSIEPNTYVHAFGEQTNVQAWGIDRSDQTSLPLNQIYRWRDASAGQNVGVFVLDTGVLTSHNDYGGRATFVTDCTSIFGTCSNNSNAGDPHGHGTHCAGSVGSNTYGIAKQVQLFDVRVLGATGGGTVNGIVNGIQAVVNRGTPAVRIISMSLGGGANTAMDNAVNSAYNAGVLSVVAAGNENQNCQNVSPARAANAFTVAASDSNDNKASFSNFGSCIDLYAPGVSILSTWNNGGTNTISGTSMACPHAAGAAALIASRGGNTSPAQIANTLRNEATTNVIGGNPSGTANRLLYTPYP